MEWWESVRRRVLVEGVSKRQVMRDAGIHWETLKKILEFSSPPGYRSVKPRGEPKIGPFRDRIREIQEEDKTAPRKQRHTAKRIFERLREEVYCPAQWCRILSAALLTITRAACAAVTQLQRSRPGPPRSALP